MITAADIRWACDQLRPVYDASDGVDGRVSYEVDPRLAHDTRRRSPRLASCGGSSTVRTSSSRFPHQGGPPRHQPVPGRGDQRQRDPHFCSSATASDGRVPRRRRAVAGSGGDLSKLGSVASFFVSRNDTETDKRLDKIGTDEARRCAARPLSRTPGWPIRSTSRYSARSAGRTWQMRAPSRSGRCGHRRVSRTRSTRTPAT